MTPAYVVQITTPKKYILNGLWFGPTKPKKLFIFVHGLAGSMFSEAEKKLTKPLITADTAVLVFNNRGHDIISKLYGEAPRTRKGYKRIVAGAAHEVFTDCVDDIEGAVAFAQRSGVKQIILMGHSTGCQKSVYWASKRGAAHPKVKAIVLLAPVSDRAAYIAELGEKKIKKAETLAKTLVKNKKSNALLPQAIWPSEADAQRVASLVSADSEEEIFLYAEEHRTPKTLQKVKIPVLVLWAEQDEYGDRPPADIVKWFDASLKCKHKIVVMPKVGHNFKGAETRAAKEVAKFMKER